MTESIEYETTIDLLTERLEDADQRLVKAVAANVRLIAKMQERLDLQGDTIAGLREEERYPKEQFEAHVELIENLKGQLDKQRNTIRDQRESHLNLTKDLRAQIAQQRETIRELQEDRDRRIELAKQLQGY